MEVAELESSLHEEGFTRTYVWRDDPETFYPDHTHDSLTAHVILEGQMILTMNGKSETHYSGDRCDVPAGVVHSALIGPHGCRYLIGEK
jgi:mannose-6-phosphate isomerase-like protein (cupin superfamily)